MRNIERLKILLWKNYQCEMKCLRKTIIEIVSIVIIYALIIINPVALFSDFESYGDDLRTTNIFPRQSLDDVEVVKRSLNIKRDIRLNLAYTPANENTKKIVEAVQKKLKFRSTIAYESEYELETQFHKRSTLAGIVIDMKKDSKNDSNSEDSESESVLELESGDNITDIIGNLTDTTTTDITETEDITTTTTTATITTTTTEEEPLRMAFLYRNKRSTTTTDGNAENSTLDGDADYSILDGDADNSTLDGNSTMDYTEDDDEDGGSTCSLYVSIRFPSSFRSVNPYEPRDQLWITRCNGIIMHEPEHQEKDLEIDLYIREGFLQLQHQVFLEWFKLQSFGSSFHFPNISVQSVLHHPNFDTCHNAAGSNLVSFLYYLSFFYPFLNLIKRLGREREENVFAHHLKYGVMYWEHWLAHFVVAFIHFSVLNIIIVFLLKVPWYDGENINIFWNTSAMMLLLFLSLYTTALIVFAMSLVCGMVKSKNSLLAGILVWISTYAMFSIVLDHSQGLDSFMVNLSFIIFFNNAFAFGMNYLQNIEKMHPEWHVWSLYIALVANIALYLCVMWHFQHYRPGKYVSRKPYNFLLLRTVCCKRKKAKQRVKPKNVTIPTRTPSWHNFEYGPLGREEFVKLKNICTYARNSKKERLQNLSMRMFRGEITVILGHNTSGKTTLLSILAGWRRPAVGTVKINGVDVYDKERKQKVLHSIDFCMADNAIFDLLTTSETITYYYRLKQTKDDPETFILEMKKWMGYMKIVVSNRETLVRDMTFEQKRLLFLCTALCGGTRVVLLDEPAQHMRWRERSLYWKILQQEKPDRAIIVATNSIEEAEEIGDRIAIMNGGMLSAYGTPFFLKTKYGVGFDLIILKDKASPTEPITEILDKYFPKITPDNQVGDQVMYKLPASKSPIFQRLLIQLENEAPSLGIKNVRVLGSELSEVYMTLGMRKNKQIISEYATNLRIMYLEGDKLVRQQISAMFYKKLIHQAPNIIPIVMIFVSFILILFIGELSKVLVVPPTRHSSIDLGFTHTANSTAMLKAFDKHACNFIEIVEVSPGTLFRKTNAQSRVFNSNSLRCHNGSFPSKDNKLRHNVFGAVEKTDKGYILWTNQNIFHSAALTLNLFHNLILREACQKDECVTTITNDPMQTPLKAKINLLDNQLTHMVVPLTVGIVMPLTVAAFICQMVEERRNHIVMLYKIAGLPMSVYWLVSLLWDTLTLMAYIVLFVIVMAVSTFEGFTMTHKLVSFLLLNVYGFSALALTYLISIYFYKSQIRSFLITSIIHVSTGICSFVFYWDVIENYDYYFYVAMLSPSFALLDGLSNIYSENKEYEYCNDRCLHFKGCTPDNICEMVPQCCAETLFKWSDPGINVSLTYMLVSGFLFIGAIFWIELNRNEKRHNPPKNVKQLRTACYPYDDRDVVAMKKRVAEADMRTCLKMRYVVDQVEDKIPKDSKELNTISFDLDKHMCLAIIGPRHSGKTHLIKQLIGEDGFRFGDIYVQRNDFKYDLDEIYSFTGYCPQNKGLYRSFTMREFMHILCMMRGVPEPKISAIIRDVALTLALQDDLRKKIGNLSFEKRRKLNIAIALLVSNDVIILDEPTTGLNAITRREIWNVMRYARFCSKTLILTTVDSLECEAMADVCIIFEDGEMMAIGSIQYLRERFTRGFYLEVKLKRDGTTAEEAQDNLHKDVENLHRFVTFLNEDSELCSQIEGWLKFYCPVRKVVYSYLFGALEKNRRRLNISSYTISQGTMEDVLRNISQVRVHKQKHYKI